MYQELRYYQAPRLAKGFDPAERVHSGGNVRVGGPSPWSTGEAGFEKSPYYAPHPNLQVTLQP